MSAREEKAVATKDRDSIRCGREHWEEKYGLAAGSSMETVSSIVRVREILVEFMDGHLAGADMSFGEYDLLNVIEVGGSMPLGKIRENARRFFSHQTSVTNVVSRLADRGLVSLSRDPADGRVTLAQLTRLGTRRLKKAHELLAAEEFGLAGLDETEKADLTALLLKVRVSHDDLRPS